jgi:hypothetical protein
LFNEALELSPVTAYEEDSGTGAEQLELTNAVNSRPATIVLARALPTHFRYRVLTFIFVLRILFIG